MYVCFGVAGNGAYVILWHASLPEISSRLVKAAADKRPRLHRDECGEFAMPVDAVRGRKLFPLRLLGIIPDQCMEAPP